MYYSLPGGDLRDSVTVIAQQTHYKQTLTKENNLKLPDKLFKPCYRQYLSFAECLSMLKYAVWQSEHFKRCKYILIL